MLSLTEHPLNPAFTRGHLSGARPVDERMMRALELKKAKEPCKSSHRQRAPGQGRAAESRH